MNKSYNFIKWISFHYVFLCILFKYILDQEVFCILVHKQPHYCSLVKQELGNAEVHNCQIQGGTFLISPSLDLLQWAVFSPHSWWSLWWHWRCRWRTGTRSSGTLQSQSWDNRRRESPEGKFCQEMPSPESRVGSNRWFPEMGIFISESFI